MDITHRNTVLQQELKTGKGGPSQSAPPTPGGSKVPISLIMIRRALKHVRPILRSLACVTAALHSLQGREETVASGASVLVMKELRAYQDGGRLAEHPLKPFEAFTKRVNSD